MPTKNAAFKALRQAKKRTVRNIARKRAIKETTKAIAETLTTKDQAALTKALAAAYKAIDKAVQKGTIHAKTGSRKKSRLMKQTNKKK